MKTEFEIRSMKVIFTVAGEEQFVETPPIRVKVEASVGELREMYKLEKEMLSEAPQLITDFVRKALITLKDIEEAVQEVQEETKCAALNEEAPQEEVQEN